MARTREMRNMFEDIGLQWGLDKCATVNVERGKIKKSRGIKLSEEEEIKVLGSNDFYKFLGKFENFEQLDEMVLKQACNEYLRRLETVWSSNLSVPRKITATSSFALPVLQYHMWTGVWNLNDLREIDRKTRKIFRQHGGVHTSESIKLAYLPVDIRGGGHKEVENIYKMTHIKMALYLNNSTDPRIQLVKAFQEVKEKKKHRSLLKDAISFGKEYSCIITLEERRAILQTNTRTIETNMASPKFTAGILKEVVQNDYKEKVKSQTWLGTLTTKQWVDDQFARSSFGIFRRWKNIPDIVYSVNKVYDNNCFPPKCMINISYKSRLVMQDVECATNKTKRFHT